MDEQQVNLILQLVILVSQFLLNNKNKKLAEVGTMTEFHCDCCSNKTKDN